jgi:5-methyltetrahydropteroyltriglutamate--homocysteine methyltransferase
VECGIDIVTDGEMSKTSFIDYVKDRLAGFEIDTSPSRGMAPTWQAEYDMFPDYYDGYLKKYSHTVAPLRRIKCTGPISYVGQDALKADIDNLKKAVEGKDVADVFMPATTPGSYGTNEYYSDRQEYLEAIADAMREEYLGIIDAGFILQIDDPGLIDTLGDPSKPVEEREREANEAIDTLNHALRDIPADKIRHHTCYGLNHGPRLTDVDLRYVAPFMLRVHAGAHSFEVANPRHQHEWRIWEDIELPEDRVLIPGLLGHANNYVEHPDLIAEYIERYAGPWVASGSSPAPTAASRRGRPTSPRCTPRWCGRSSRPTPRAPPSPAGGSGAEFQRGPRSPMAARLLRRTVDIGSRGPPTLRNRLSSDFRGTGVLHKVSSVTGRGNLCHLPPNW